MALRKFAFTCRQSLDGAGVFVLSGASLTPYSHILNKSRQDAKTFTCTFSFRMVSGSTPSRAAIAAHSSGSFRRSTSCRSSG